MREMPAAGGGTAYVHPSAQLYGEIALEADCSVWPNAVIRAEMHGVRIGRRSNVQDFVMIHVGFRTPTVVGEDCSITHHCNLHGCTLGDRVLVGIGATVMDGCVIGDNCIVAGHSFLKEGTVVPPNSVVMGAPARVTAQKNNGAANALNAWLYHQNAMAYVRGEHRLWASEAFGRAIREEQARLEGLSF